MSDWFWLLPGALAGVGHVLLLRLAVAQLRPGHPWPAAAAFVLSAALRVALAAGVLFLALRQGLVPLLYALAGLWLARWPLLFRYSGVSVPWAWPEARGGLEGSGRGHG